MQIRHMSKIRNRGASLDLRWIRDRVREPTYRVDQGSVRDLNSGADPVSAAGSDIRDGFGKRMGLEIRAGP